MSRTGIKGGRAKSLASLKKDMKKRSEKSGGAWVKGLQEGETVVRFLDEPVDWFRYEEHYDEDLGFFPCSEVDCVGCSSSNKRTKRTSTKYLTNALLVDDGAVVPLKLTLTLAERLTTKADRKGTLLDRDYILIREGKDLNTKYDLDDERPSKINFAKYDKQRHDLEEVLVETLRSLDDDDDDEDDEDEDDRPRRSSSRNTSTSRSRTGSNNSARRRRRR